MAIKIIFLLLAWKESNAVYSKNKKQFLNFMTQVCTTNILQINCPRAGQQNICSGSLEE